MTGPQIFQEDEGHDKSSSETGIPLENGGQVVVTYQDAPPSAGKKSIHPRRPAPIVPDKVDTAADQLSSW